MALSIVSVNPADGSNSITIDTSITIELTDFVDPFTVPAGINLYVLSKAIWDTSELAQLDTKYSDVLDIGEVNTYFPFNFQITDKVITITPSVSLLPDSTYYVEVFPGNDASRYLSTKTTGTPIVISMNNNTIDITSAYTGSTDDTLEITFSSSDGESIDTLDVSKGIKSMGTYKFQNGVEVNIGELSFILHGNSGWEIGDSIAIPVFKAVGLTDVNRVTFITTKYTTMTPKSNKIQYVSDSEEQLSIIKTFPENGSMDNKSCNPIIIKFNKTLDQTQDLTNAIDIKRISFDNGETKNVTKYYKIDNDTLKIYMISTARRV